MTDSVRFAARCCDAARRNKGLRNKDGEARSTGARMRGENKKDCCRVSHIKGAHHWEGLARMKVRVSGVICQAYR